MRTRYYDIITEINITPYIYFEWISDSSDSVPFSIFSKYYVVSTESSQKTRLTLHSTAANTRHRHTRVDSDLFFFYPRVESVWNPPSTMGAVEFESYIRDK